MKSDITKGRNGINQGIQSLDANERRNAIEQIRLIGPYQEKTVYREA